VILSEGGRVEPRRDIVLIVIALKFIDYIFKSKKRIAESETSFRIDQSTRFKSVL